MHVNIRHVDTAIGSLYRSIGYLRLASFHMPGGTVFAVMMVAATWWLFIQPLVEKKHNTPSVQLADRLGSMHADATKTRQILVNLLSNAAEFTENGKITLTAWREMVDGVDWVNFRVADTDIGVSSEQMERIFQVLNRQTVKSSVIMVVGLGLRISLRLCRLKGGDITVSSEIEKGSSFTIRLPAVVGRS